MAKADGISSLTVDQAQGLEQRLCRIQNRTRRFGWQGTVRISDPKDMTGRLISTMLEVIPEIGGVRPTNKSLARAIGISEPTFSRFLAGDAGGTTPWFHRAADLIKMIVAGQSPDPELLAIARRVADYFFREPSQSDGVPRFFSGARVHSPDPWSRTELAQEILWLARQRQLNSGADARARLVFCSGWTPFMQGDQAGHIVTDATVAAVEAGVETTFCFMRGTAAEQSIQSMVRRVPSLETSAQLIALSPKTPSRWVEYLTRTVQFMYFDAPTLNQGLQSSLYLLRAGIFDEQSSDDQALAITCNATETGQFRGWLDSVDLTTSTTT